MVIISKYRTAPKPGMNQRTRMQQFGLIQYVNELSLIFSRSYDLEGRLGE